MKKWVVSRHDSIELVSKLESSLGVTLNLSHSAQARCEEPDDGVIFLHFDDSLLFVQTPERFIPFLGSSETLALFPSAQVDEGAIKFLLNGADVMRPGVKSFEDWGPVGRVVIIKEALKGRAITVAESIVPSSEMSGMAKGPCLKNLHHVGDRYWNLYKTV